MSENWLKYALKCCEMTNVVPLLKKYIRTNHRMINLKVIYVIHHTERVCNVSQHEIFTYRRWRRNTQYQICEGDLQNKSITQKPFTSPLFFLQFCAWSGC